MVKPVDIRLALTEQDRRMIADLRRRESVHHPESAGDSPDAVHAPDALDTDCFLFGAFEEGRVVLTMRLHLLREHAAPQNSALQLERFGHYHPSKMSVISGITLATGLEWDSEAVGHMLRQVLCFGYLHKMEFICGVFEPGLEPILKGLGFRRYLPDEAFRDLEGAVPMAFALSDVEHLISLKSPLAVLFGAGSKNNFAPVYFRQMLDEISQEAHPKKGRQATLDND